jgi:hypothetical protein
MKIMRTKVIEYIKKNLKKGYTVDSLKYALVNQGYSRSVVERAIEEVTKELAAEAPILKDKPKITYQIIDEHDRPITMKKPWWKRVFS